MRFWDLDDLAMTHWRPWESWPPRDRDLPDEWDVRRDLDLPSGWAALDELPRTMRHNRPSWFYFWGGPGQYRSNLRERSWKRNRSTQYKVTDMTTRVYKIRRRSDGFYSTGGSHPRFSRVGKVWNGSGAVKAHLKLVWRRDEKYADCEVVEFAVTQPEINAIPIKDFLESV